MFRVVWGRGIVFGVCGTVFFRVVLCVGDCSFGDCVFDFTFRVRLLFGDSVFFVVLY